MIRGRSQIIHTGTVRASEATTTDSEQYVLYLPRRSRHSGAVDL